MYTNHNFFKYKNQIFRTSDSVTAILSSSYKVDDARVLIITPTDVALWNNTPSHFRPYKWVGYICNNKYDGWNCREKLGYKYSWVFAEERQDALRSIIDIQLNTINIFDNIITNAFPVLF